MANWTEADLQKQLQNATDSGWIPFFEASATLHDFPLELLLAIASRETGMKNIKGDFRNGIWHGFGIMQVDIGTAPDFCKAWTPENVEGSIQLGVNILAGKRTYLAGKGITDVKAIAAAYNTGEGNVAKSVAAGADPDRTTAGGNYGSDVLARRDAIATLLPTADPATGPATNSNA